MDLEKYLQTDTELYEKYQDIKRACKELRSDVKLPWFTDHSPTHSARLVQYLNQILAPLKDTKHALNKQECFILLASCYLHDIGMQDMHRNGKPTEWLTVEDYERIRRHHPDRSYEMIREGVLRPKGRKSVDLDLEYDADWALPLMRVCKAYSTAYFKEMVEEFAADPIYVQNTPIRGEFLCALLMMADELDLTRERVSFKDIHFSNLLPESQVYWYIHHYIEKSRVENQLISIRFRLPEEVYLYRQIFQDRVKRKLDKQLTLCNPIFGEATQNTIQLTVANPECTVDRAGLLEKMPQEVLDALLKEANGPTGDEPSSIRAFPPPMPSPLFTGREEERRKLAKLISDDSTSSPRVSMIVGIGGTGKTQLVAKCVSEQRHYPSQKVFWFDISQQHTADDIAVALGYEEMLKSDKMPSKQKGVYISSAIEKSEALIVIDNAQEIVDSALEAMVEHAVSHLKDSRIILISKQRTTLINKLEPMLLAWDIGGLADNGPEYAHRLRDQLGVAVSDDELNGLCEKLDNHPLAIDVALRILRYGVTPDKLASKIGQFAKNGGAGEALSKRLLGALHGRANESECNLAYRLSVFRKPFPRNAVGFLATGAGWEVNLNVLVDRLMLRLDNGLYTMHPLVKIFCYEELPDKRSAHAGAADYYKSCMGETPDVVSIVEMVYHLLISGNHKEATGTLEERGEELFLQGHTAALQAMLADTAEHNALTDQLRLVQGRLHELFGLYEKANEDFSLCEACEDDEIRAEAMFRKGYLQIIWGNIPEASQLFERSQVLAESIRLERVRAYAINGVAVIAETEGMLSDALSLQQKCLDILSNLPNAKRSDVAVAIGCVGNVLHSQGKYGEALEKYKASLRINEEIGYLRGIAASLGWIANVLHSQAKYGEALEKYKASLRINEEIGDRAGIAASLRGIANVLYSQGMYDEALEKYKASLRINEEIGDRWGIATSLGNIANVHLVLGINGDDPKSEAEGAEETDGYQDTTEQARQTLATGNYLAARQLFDEIPRNERAIWDKLRAEFSFAFKFEMEAEDDEKARQNRLGQVDWRRSVWAALAIDSDGERLQDEETPEVNSDDTIEDDSKPHVVTADEKEPTRLTNEQKGEALEQDTLNLLRHLFVFDDSDVILLASRQQSRGTQFGCDIKLECCSTRTNRHVRCLVECKSHEDSVNFNEILGKLYDAKHKQVNIDHWILIAPRCHVTNGPDNTVDVLNSSRDFPFQIQFWTKETDIHKLFGLEPDLYERWFGSSDDIPNPREWTAEDRERVRQSWLMRLQPQQRLPTAWEKYVANENGHRWYIENDDREGLAELNSDRYLPPHALDGSRTPLLSPLGQAVRQWLNKEETRVCLILGDFGDGKSAFTYMLTRELLAEFRENPRDGWIPIRFSLGRFARPNFNARSLLEDRMYDIGAKAGEWGDVVAHNKVLVILDGMDEMTKTLNADAVRTAIDLLIDCCDNQFEVVKKIIITCRAPFFEELAQRQYVESKLDSPRILYIERFDRRRVYDKLTELAPTPVQKLKLQKMRHMHDPIGLAGKALFFKMVSENLADPNSDFSSETKIYENYIKRCLDRGARAGMLDSADHQIPKENIIPGLQEIMERIAMEIQFSEKDYVCLGKLNMCPDEAAYAKILWQHVEGEQSEEDAVRRVGVRSLLHKKTQGVDPSDAGAWPVDFCHRSVREYFVALYIERTLRQGTTGFDVLANVDFNHEVLRFAGELMKAGHDDYEQTLHEMALRSRVSGGTDGCSQDEKYRNARLGRTAVTLLYKWRGSLPGDDWSNLTLDGAQLAGVDLTGKNFRNTSLRAANLNSAVFVKADFRGADLTGVRLEETGAVCALSVPHSLDGFFAGYRDGSIRHWCFSDRTGQRSRIVHQPRDGRSSQDRSFQLAALPGDGLCVLDRPQITFLDSKADYYQDSGSFAVRGQCLGLAFNQAGLVAVRSESESHVIARVFDFSDGGFPQFEDIPIEACVHCERLGANALATAVEDGRLLVYYRKAHRQANGLPLSVQIAEFAHPSAIAVCDLGGVDGNDYLIACGSSDGTVGLWQWHFGGSETGPNVREIFRDNIHMGAVTAVCFAGGEDLLTGGTDGKVLRLGLSDPQAPVVREDVFELRLQCQGMKIEGLKGPVERDILEGLINEV